MDLRINRIRIIRTRPVILRSRTTALAANWLHTAWAKLLWSFWAEHLVKAKGKACHKVLMLIYYKSQHSFHIKSNYNFMKNMMTGFKELVDNSSCICVTHIDLLNSENCFDVSFFVTLSATGSSFRAKGNKSAWSSLWGSVTQYGRKLQKWSCGRGGEGSRKGR